MSFFKKYATLQEDYYTLKEHCLEQEQTLEELGTQLSVTKLQISDLKEEANRNRSEGTWVKDKSTTNCKGCNKEFSLTRRRVRFQVIVYESCMLLLFYFSIIVGIVVKYSVTLVQIIL